MKGLTDIPGIRVGQVSDFEALTGCTVVLCDGGAVGGYDIGGGATGTEDMEVLSPHHITDRIHAVVLAGGSAFGLEAASGVRRYLEKQGVGYPTGAARVPIVVGAILYDLGIGRADVRPTREMGERAAAVATAGPVEEGSVGAGTGATVGKVFGMARAMKGGVGTYTVEMRGGVLVAALAVVNAIGDVLDAGTGKRLAGARRAVDSRELVDSAAAIRDGMVGGLAAPPRNTTLVVVATNAQLTKTEANRLARLAQHGLVRSIQPVHTSMDGDLVVALSLGQKQARVDSLAVAASEAVAQAVLRGVKQAKTLGGVPGLAG